jgi:hypothetical protein
VNLTGKRFSATLPYAVFIASFFSFCIVPEAQQSPPEILWMRGGTGSPPLALDLSADGRFLATAEPGHQEQIYSLEFSPSGDLLASGSGDTTIRLWRTDNGNALGTLTGHTNVVLGLCFSPDGKTLASAGYDKSIRLWDVQLGSQSQTLQPGMYATSIAYSPNGEFLINTAHEFPVSLRSAVQIWRAADGTLAQEITREALVPTSVQFSPDGGTLAFGRIDGSVVMMRNPVGSGGQQPQFVLVPEANRLLLRIQGTTGARYGVQRSSDLQLWFDWTTLDGAGPGATVPIDPLETKATFYRVIIL